MKSELNTVNNRFLILLILRFSVVQVYIIHFLYIARKLSVWCFMIL